MSIDWNAVAHQWHADQPHPLNPLLKVGEFAQAVKLATKTKFGGHATPEEAGAFHVEFTALNTRLAEQGKPPISPDEYSHLIDRVAPHSFAFQGRPPTMEELVRHREAEPSTVAKYYGDLPDRTYPHVTSRDMAKYLTLSEPFAKMHVDRYPNRLEAARFALGGMNAQGIGDYYQAIGAADISQGKDNLLLGRIPGAPPEDFVYGEGGLERRIREMPPPLSGDRRTPWLPPRREKPAKPVEEGGGEQQGGGKDTGVTE